MTEKEILRELLEKAADNLQIFTATKDLAEEIYRVLTDTEDTGGIEDRSHEIHLNDGMDEATGEENYTWRSCKLVAADTSDKEKTLLTFNVGPFDGLPTIRTCDYWAIPIRPINGNLPPKEPEEKGGPSDAVYARMNQNNWRVMSRSLAESNKYTEIISAGRPYPGRLIEPKEQDDEVMEMTIAEIISATSNDGKESWLFNDLIPDAMRASWKAACKWMASTEQDDEAMYKTLDILWDRHYGIKKFPRRGIVHDVAVFTWEAACKYCKGVRS